MAKSIKELINNLKKVSKEVMEEEVSEKLESVVRKRIDSDVYSKYTPEIYDRTYDLKASVDSEIESTKDGVRLIINHNTNEMNHYSVMGKADNEYVRENLPRWINNGEIYPLWGTSLSFTYLEPRSYIDNSIEEIKNKDIHIKALKAGLRKKKIKIE